MAIRIGWWLVCIVYSFGALAQPLGPNRYTALSKAGELPIDDINDLTQDDQGYLWVATWKGLYRYDGYRAVNFGQLNTQFRGLKITSLRYSAKDHTLWLGTFADGAFAIDTYTHRFRQYLPNGPLGRRVADANIISIGLATDGRVFLGGENNGLSVLQGDSLQVWHSRNSALPSDQVSAILPGAQGDLWLGTGNGVCYSSGIGAPVVRIAPEQLQHFVYDLRQASDGSVWVGHKDGCHRIQAQSGRWHAQQISTVLTRSIQLGTPPNEQLWLGTIEGLWRADEPLAPPARQSFWPQDLGPNGNITTLFVSRDGTLFLGTNQGLFAVHPHKKAFRGVLHPPHRGIKSTVSAIEVSGDSLLTASWGGDIWLHNLADGTRQSILPQIPNYRGYVYSLLLHQSVVWLACKNAPGLHRFDLRHAIGGRIAAQHITHYLNDAAGPERIVTRIYLGPDGQLWIGTWQGELLRWSDSAQRPVPYLPLDRLPWAGYPIRSIAQDKRGNLWVGTSGKGYFVMPAQQAAAPRDTTANDLAFVNQLFVGANGNVWVLGEKSLIAHTPQGQTQHHIGEHEQMDMHSLTEDLNGFVWVATNKGIVRINSNLGPQSNAFFTHSDGLTNQNFFHHSVARAQSGELFFGGTEGVDRFLPHQIDYNYQRPQPVLTELLLHRQPVLVQQSYQGRVLLHQSIGQTTQLRLHHTQNSFELAFSNLNYNLPQKAIYAYQLQGADPDWVVAQPGQQRASYSNLRWGKYTFLLKSCNNDGFWNETPTRLEILIEPPFWASHWAYALYASLLAALMFFFNNRTIVKVRHLHAIELNELRYRKQQELDEAKLRFFTNLSHELRTPLTLILGPLSRILETDEGNRWKEYHLLMYRNADRLLKLINRLMDFSKDELEKLHLQVRMGSLEAHLQQIYHSFRVEAVQRGIDYHFEASPDLPLVYFDPEFVESIVFNLLSNAFKYSHPGGQVRVQVTRWQLDRRPFVSIRIADTGQGIAPEHMNRIFERFYSADRLHSGTGIGLSFTKRLVDLHHGQIAVESRPGQGATFTVLLPIDFDYPAHEKADQNPSPAAGIDWAKVDLAQLRHNQQALENLKRDEDKNRLIALVADDNMDLRSYVRDILKDTFVVVEADNGEDALTLARELLPDILISDVMMPRLDGFGLCEAVKNDPRTDHIPVILTTVLGSQEDRIRGLKSGADSYIPKPIHAEHLLVRVRRLLEQQQRLRKKYTQLQLSPSASDGDTPSNHTQTLHPLLAEATQAVLRHLHDSEYSVDDFSNDLKLSRMQLYRKLKALTGLSANAFVRKVRLQRAAELLTTGKYSVKEVTYDVGFNDLKYFRKCFKEEFGYPPSELLPFRDEDDESETT